VVHESTIPGVRVVLLTAHADERGRLAEIFRDDWNVGIPVPQWTLLDTVAGGFRGVHVHFRHTDYIVVVAGQLDVGLSDLRRGSPTEGAGEIVSLRGDELRALVIPPGVAHGFHSRVATTALAGTSHLYDPGDDLGCRWDDPALAIPWQEPPAVLSERDRTAGSLADLLAALEAHQPL
jgi:dTDP-4-dehydrorhamnose 3,5-epimerase